MKPIRIHHADTEQQVRSRHEEIIRRLEEFGEANVRTMMGSALPTQWNPIILSWLKGDKLEPATQAELKTPPPPPPKMVLP